jgi:hypothetical protein
MTAKDVPSPIFNSPGTTAYWDASPSPVSPRTRKEKSSPVSTVIRKSGSAPRSRWAATQRRRTCDEGSPNSWARISLRERHKVAGRSQLNEPPFGRSFSNVPISWQSHPAPSWEIREETCFPRAAAAPTSTM